MVYFWEWESSWAKELHDEVKEDGNSEAKAVDNDDSVPDEL